MICPIIVVMVDPSKNGPTGCLVSPPPVLSPNTYFTQKAPAGHGDRGDNAHRLLFLLIFLMLQFPELEWVGICRKSGRGRKTGESESEGRSGANGVRGGIRVEVGNGDGNGVGDGNGDVNVDGDGDGTGRRTEVEATKGT